MEAHRFHPPPAAKRRHLRNALLIVPAFLVCLWFIATQVTLVWLGLAVIALGSFIGSIAAWAQTRPIAEVTDTALVVSGPFRSRSARWDQIVRLRLHPEHRVGYVVTQDPAGRERTLFVPLRLLGEDASAELVHLIEARRPDLAPRPA